MARVTGTKEQLMEAHYELQQFQKYQPTVAAMLGGRIESFYKNNEAKLQAISEHRKKIYDKYVQKTDDGKNFKFTEAKEGQQSEPEFIQPIIELGETEKAKWLLDTKTAFQKELNEYLSQQVDWIV